VPRAPLSSRITSPDIARFIGAEQPTLAWQEITCTETFQAGAFLIQADREDTLRGIEWCLASESSEPFELTDRYSILIGIFIGLNPSELFNYFK